MFVFCIATAIASPSQTFTVLASFVGTNGDEPDATLVQATDGNFYGTTAYGGPNSMGGSIFSVSPGGALNALYGFCSVGDCSDGEHSFSGVIQATDGNFYGTTQAGGKNPGNRCQFNGCGTVFQITPEGALTTLHAFVIKDGSVPSAGLVEATNGELYGTTSAGGRHGDGTVFKITLEGKLTTLHTFDGADGSSPVAALVQATNGDFYGTTSGGNGTVFEMTPGGKLTTLYSFSGPDGSSPAALLVQATDGNFYGTTSGGGANSMGTVFQITPAGALTTLHSFSGSYPEGATPLAGLVQATDANFYGTTSAGGEGGGTVFEVDTAGNLTTLYDLDWDSGDLAYGGLIQGTDGNLYGTTGQGGANCCGTVFRLSMGLGPFVEMQTTSGKVKTAVVILGTNLTGAAGVSFNGATAAFTVVSSSEITTEVPAGATTGTVSVETPGGTLYSNVAFRVTPQLRSFAPASGPVGTPVQITGVSLSQTTAVAFGSVAATEFTVNSDKDVTATVPSGAGTGPITITTLGGIATSKASFTVTE